MKYLIEDTYYNLEIIKKNNKHTYIRVKDDLTISVTTNYFVSKHSIIKLLDDNKEYIKKMITTKNNNKINEFYLLGKKYNVIIDSNIKNIEINNQNLYVSSENYLDNWIKKEMKLLFSKRLKMNYDLFEESIPFPTLKIRTMKTRWGVCNRKNNTITLNSLLIRKSIDKLDYVIIHELSHFVYFNHSKKFWEIVYKYCPDYKKVRKKLKEGEL